MITITAKAIVDKTKIADYKSVSEKLIVETRKEPGCISYSLFEDKENPCILTFIEQWKDQQAVETHFNSDHFKLYVPQLAELRKDMELNMYTNLFA